MKKLASVGIALHLLMLLTLSCLPAAVFAGKPFKDISIQENNRLITAPQGQQYSWSFNGELIADAKEQSLAPKESGTYTVSFFDEFGKASTASIAVVVSEDGRIIRIFTIGDSTVQNYNDGWYPRKGWGQVLQSFFDPAGVSIINEAVGGTSSRSFYNDFWPAVKDQLQAGDFVFIQFGINDRSSDVDRRAMGEDFKNFLRNYVNETKAKGAFPVLVSTVRRDNWNADGTMYDNYHEHPQLVRDVAAEMNVPLVDLDTKSKALMERLGESYTGRYFYNIYEPGEYPNYPNGSNDDVHFQEMGAIEMAKIVVEEIQNLSDDENINQLIPHIKPQHEVRVSPNKPNVGLVTRATSYPEGLTITLKAIPATGHNFLYWKDADGNLISDQKIYMFTMGNEDRNIIGYFDDEETEFDCNGDMGGTAMPDNCGICAGGATGISACTQSIQAEDACVDGTVETGIEGFKGTGYAQGASLSWFMDGSTNLEYKLTIRYANSDIEPIEAMFLLNDEELGTLSFPPTATETNWNAVSQTMTLNRGSNTLELVALSEKGLPEIDLFSWSVDHVRAGSGECPTTITALDLLESSAGLKVYPNPVVDKLYLESKEPFQYQIYDLSGKLQASGSCSANCQIDIPQSPGLYQLLLKTKKGSYITKIMRK